MKTHAAPGGLVGRGTKRRSLLLFAVLLVIAQILLFAVLRQRSRSDDAASPSVAPQTAATQPPPASPAPAPQAAPNAPPPSPSPAQSAIPATPTPEPENQPIESKTATNADSATEGKDDGGHRRDREKNDRADRERDRRERIQAEREREQAREREREQARERARLESERDRARLEAEKERAKLEVERAEKARLDVEREKAQLQAERERLQAERNAARETQDRDPAELRPSGGSPDVLVVIVSRAGSGGLSREAIRNIYFGKTTFWPNNTPVRAFNRPAGSPAGRKFYRSILGTSASSFQEHWNGLQLSGGGISPQTVSSADSMIARVAGSSGGIGYVLESELPEDVAGVRLIRFK